MNPLVQTLAVPRLRWPAGGETKEGGAETSSFRKRPESGLPEWEVFEVFHEFASGATCALIARRRGKDADTVRTAVTEYWWIDHFDKATIHRRHREHV